MSIICCCTFLFGKNASIILMVATDISAKVDPVPKEMKVCTLLDNQYLKYLLNTTFSSFMKPLIP
jgi:hypothetical protein